MDNEHVVKKWQYAIARDCEVILGRELRRTEREFIMSRGGFIALEMIHDHVKSLTGKPAELQEYLQSERERE